MSLLVRSSVDHDLPAITAIYAHAVTHGTSSFELDPPDQVEMSRRRAALLDGDYPYMVAERDGIVLGYAYAGPYRARPAYRSTVEDSIYIAPDSHRQGVGRALLSALIRESEARDFRLMVAVIGDEESRGSIELHAGLGFEPAGIFKGVGYKHGRWLSTVLMQRPLGPGIAMPPTRPIR